MFQNIERYLSFLITNKLTQQQFLFLYLIYKKKYDCIVAYKNAFPTGDGSMIGQKEQENLVIRGFITKVDKTDRTADSYQLTEKFDKLFLKDIHEATNQFYEAYPGFININGVNSPLQNIDRYEFATIYGERIDYSVDEHLEVIKDLKYGRDKNLLRNNLKDFLFAEGWRKIREIRVHEEQVPKEVIEKLDNNF